MKFQQLFPLTQTSSPGTFRVTRIDGRTILERAKTDAQGCLSWALHSTVDEPLDDILYKMYTEWKFKRPKNFRVTIGNEITIEKCKDGVWVCILSAQKTADLEEFFQ